MNYKTDAFLITCLTNMHVGAGGANYGVVDNLVQRDPVTGMPVIHSSGLKGALREFFKNKWGENDQKLNYIFGLDNSRTKTSGKASIGHYKFFGADLIALPVRSNKKPFYRATAKMLVDTINNKAAAFGIENLISGNYNYDKSPAIEDNGNVKLEDWSAQQQENLTVWNKIGENPAVFNNDQFKQLAKHLPVIARNQLENGESKNLWYEEVVPRESRFVFFVSVPDGNNHYDKFIDLLTNNTIQIGANASIGYGYVSIDKLPTIKSTDNEQ